MIQIEKKNGVEKIMSIMIHSPRGSFVWGSEAYFLGVPPGAVLDVPLGVVLDLPPDFLLIILGVLLFLAFLAVGNSEASRFEALSFRFRFFGFLGCVALLVAGLASSEDNFLLLSIINSTVLFLTTQYFTYFLQNLWKFCFLNFFNTVFWRKKSGFLLNKKEYNWSKTFVEWFLWKFSFPVSKTFLEQIEAKKGTKTV